MQRANKDIVVTCITVYFRVEKERNTDRNTRRTSERVFIQARYFQV